jgi:hypothetical protein
MTNRYASANTATAELAANYADYRVGAQPLRSR